VLGGAFFTAFLGIFDTENERIGFATSARGLPGNTMTCIGDCNEDDGATNFTKYIEETEQIIVVGLAVLIFGVLICFIVVCCRRR